MNPTKLERKLAKKQTELTEKEIKAALKNLEELEKMQKRMRRAVKSELTYIMEWQFKDGGRKVAAHDAISVAIDAYRRLLYEGHPAFHEIYFG